MRSHRTLTAGVLGVVGMLVTAMVATHPASASQLHVSSAPLQTWRLENAAPVLPGITPASSSRATPKRHAAESSADEATSEGQDDASAAPSQPETTPEDAAGPDEPDTEPADEATTDPVAPPSDSSDPSETSGPATDEANGSASPPADLEACGDLSQYDDVVYGTAGDDNLVAGAGPQVLVGLGGDDVLTGGDGDDCLVGGAGDDDLIGVAAEDELDGGPGIDATAPTGDAVTVPLADVMTTSP